MLNIELLLVNLIYFRNFVYNINADLTLDKKTINECCEMNNVKIRTNASLLSQINLVFIPKLKNNLIFTVNCVLLEKTYPVRSFVFGSSVLKIESAKVVISYIKITKKLLLLYFNLPSLKLSHVTYVIRSNAWIQLCISL